MAVGAGVLTAGGEPATRAAAGGDQVELVVSREGFRPKTLNARKGETLRLILRTTDVEHCFALDALRIEKRILPGRSTPADITPDRVGSFPFHCCLEPGNEAQRGRLVVSE
ncbi:MAG TPA: cupredoxin domain-containing protein [Vicinamibacteria bacterium]|nr:cupredoxin domain-containing protein [Vicinamibacteria bacterium]